MNKRKENTQNERCCSKCKNVFPLTAQHFFREKNRPLGFGYICKLCSKQISIEKHFKRYYGFYDKEKHRRKIYYWGKGHITSQIKNYRQQDEKKGLICTLTVEFFEKLFPNICFYCGEPIRSGLDRIDNTKPHTPNNVVPCCKLCNWTKSNRFTQEEMILLGKVIAQIKQKRGSDLG